MNMPSPVVKSEAKCSRCGESLSASLRHCPTCQTDAGAPNVRASGTDENLKALTARFEDAQTRASAKGCLKEFDTLTKLIETQSGVVVSMPARLARSLMEDPSFLYLNYVQLVGANIRKPASPGNDRYRSAVEGILFGSYAKHIRYGVLSMTEEGLPTYGEVHCRLRSVTIDNRTSFLETNSYTFVSDHSLSAGDELPVGYAACWEKRHCLVLAKLVQLLSTGQTERDWQAKLIRSDGKDRNNDDFVEAHVFGSFDRNAINSVVGASDKGLSREKKLDRDLAISAFEELSGK